MGAQRLQRQAEDVEKEYDDVSEKVRSGIKNMAEKIRGQHLSRHFNSSHCSNQIWRIFCIFFFFVGISFILFSEYLGGAFALCISLFLFVKFYVIFYISSRFQQKHTIGIHISLEINAVENAAKWELDN